MPLYHFVITDLPSNTKAPEMDNANAVRVLEVDAQLTGDDISVNNIAGAGVGVDTDKGHERIEHLMGFYLSYLIAIDFLPLPLTPSSPPSGGENTGSERRLERRSLPFVNLTKEQLLSQRYIGGRAAALISSGSSSSSSATSSTVPEPYVTGRK